MIEQPQISSLGYLFLTLLIGIGIGFLYGQSKSLRESARDQLYWQLLIEQRRNHASMELMPVESGLILELLQYLKRNPIYFFSRKEMISPSEVPEIASRVFKAQKIVNNSNLHLTEPEINYVIRRNLCR